MDFRKGMVVISRAGRDSGRAMAVVDIRDGYVFVADGKERRLEAPKRKNPKHLAKTDRIVSLEEMTNRRLRTVLREQAAEESE
ncbi:MAG: KOW domain-containing RNA-binding protein [Bacteroides sp.]|nr:KOW domain-containing RNA-binding protein [Eubacterium sp.]MCM1417818.1 KOW domain-containing RNA-binding protein [Roseburia sp.]MCM1461257.1 KOW domain-containing RNA-binding protein [Bacteroides sp.]